MTKSKINNTNDLQKEISRGFRNSRILVAIGERLPKLVRELLYQFYRIRAERKVLKGYKTTLPLLDKNIAELQAGMQTPEYKRSRFPQFFNNMLFFHLAIKDILLTHKELLLAKDLGVQNMHTRTLALHLYEFAQDFQKLNGKDFRHELATIPDSKEILKRFDNLKRYFHQFRPDYEVMLKDIRHHTIAHKDNDALLLHNKLSGIDHLKIIEIETAAFLLFALYDKFQKDTAAHFAAHQPEIAAMPYPNGYRD